MVARNIWWESAGDCGKQGAIYRRMMDQGRQTVKRGKAFRRLGVDIMW